MQSNDMHIFINQMTCIYLYGTTEPIQHDKKSILT